VASGHRPIFGCVHNTGSSTVAALLRSPALPLTSQVTNSGWSIGAPGPALCRLAAQTFDASVSDPMSQRRLVHRRLETGQDRWKAAGERRCQRPAASTICHGASRVVLIPTAVSCCASAARRLTVTFRDTISIACLRQPKLHEPEGW
jgi:hypothetical protein